MRRPRALAGVALALLLTGCSVNPPSDASAPATSTPEHPVASSAPTATPKPSVPAVPIQGTANTSVRATVPPVRVAVPDAGIDVEVEPVGVLSNGEMELPDNTRVAGWYKYGPDPASATGATILAAHVDSLVYGLGPFSRLKELAAGARVTVTTSDGAIHAYTVASVERVAKAEIPLDTVFDRAGPSHLVLMTCGGQFNYETGHYLDNILAIATPVGP